MTLSVPPMRGKLINDGADRNPDYRYLRPAPLPPIRGIRDLDPQRLYPDREFPRWTDIIVPALRTEAFIDYRIDIKPIGDGGWQVAELVLLPNEHTRAKVERVVASGRFSIEISLQDGKLQAFVDELVHGYVRGLREW